MRKTLKKTVSFTNNKEVKEGNNCLKINNENCYLVFFNIQAEFNWIQNNQFYFVLDNDNFGTFASLPGNEFPPTEERAGPEGAEEEPPRVIATTTSSNIPNTNSSNRQSGDEDDAEDEDEEQCKWSSKSTSRDLNNCI